MLCFFPVKGVGEGFFQYFAKERAKHIVKMNARKMYFVRQFNSPLDRVQSFRCLNYVIGNIFIISCVCVVG